MEVPLQQGLVELATASGQSLLWVFCVLAIIAGSIVGVWALLPVLAYTSEDITSGSPFDAAFRIENASPWFPLAHLRIRCVLYTGGPRIPPVTASEVEIAGPDPSRLGPGASATFKCPLRAVLPATNDELSTALRSELYFRSTYDLPLLTFFRLTDNRGPFVLDTRVLPPRWAGKM